MIDRSQASRALAKAIAYKQSGKDREAALWAAELVRLLELSEILRPDYIGTRMTEEGAEPAARRPPGRAKRS